MKYYIIAGEASGDLHGSNLIAAIKKQQPSVSFRGFGGDLMESKGMELVKHYRELAFMGFIEVLLNIRTIFRNIRLCKNDIAAYNPDVIVFIDYPGFNLRIAGWAKLKGWKTIYYISPQVWAWKENRVKKIKQYVDSMFVILPFEKAFYQKHQFNVDYEGHPLLDAIHQRSLVDKNELFQKYALDENRKILVLLPGSRKQEVSKLLPVMLGAAEKIANYQVVIAQAPSLSKEFYGQFSSKVKIIKNATYDLLQIADFAFVTSGTATLETALFKVPQIVCYKGSTISYFIARMVIKVKYISLVNLIMDREVVPELIQNECTVDSLFDLFVSRSEGEKYCRVKKSYEELHQKLGEKNVSERVANKIISVVEE